MEDYANFFSLESDDFTDEELEFFIEEYYSVQLIEEDFLTERQPLSISQRLAKGRTMKRLAPKMKRARERMKKRMVPQEKLMVRARKAAIALIRKRVAGKKGERYNQLSPSERMGIDRMVMKKMSTVGKLAKRLLPVVKKKALETMKSARSVKEETDMKKILRECIKLHGLKLVEFTDGKSFKLTVSEAKQALSLLESLKGDPYQNVFEDRLVESIGSFRHALNEGEELDKAKDAHKKEGDRLKVKQEREKENAKVRDVKDKDSAVNEAAGKGRPRGAPHIENVRFWDLPKDQLDYIRKDAAAAVKANPQNPKNIKGKGNYADQISDAGTVLNWRKKKGLKEGMLRFKDFGKAPERKIVSEEDRIRRNIEKKSERTGVPVDILEKVLNRGLEQGDEQSAFERMNSFANGGAARELDADLQEFQDTDKGGNPKKSLPPPKKIALVPHDGGWRFYVEESGGMKYTLPQSPVKPMVNMAAVKTFSKRNFNVSRRPLWVPKVEAAIKFAEKKYKKGSAFAKKHGVDGVYENIEEGLSSSMYALVKNGKVVEKGSKAKMVSAMKKAKKETGLDRKNLFVGNSPSKKVGDMWESLEEKHGKANPVARFMNQVSKPSTHKSVKKKGDDKRRQKHKGKLYEVGGAGEQGTDELAQKYADDTPGQDANIKQDFLFVDKPEIELPESIVKGIVRMYEKGLSVEDIARVTKQGQADIEAIVAK
jgi:hypothetical protein